jgi:TRAP-type C4-dicarboxylate transport system substrate-binding protein
MYRIHRYGGNAVNVARTRIAAIAIAVIFSAGACSGAGGVPGTAPPASGASDATPAASGASSQGTSASLSPFAITDAPATLRLAIADGAGRPSEAAVNHFVTRVATLSGGNMTIVPTFGAVTEKGFEVGVADLVERGEAELGVAASRAWDLTGVTSLQALQAPYLIDNDALAVAVAMSDIGQRALDGMSGDVIGLTLWPEDLRHLFSFPACGKDFRDVSGVAGSTILVQPSAATRALLQALGGIEWTGTDREGDARACTLHGQEAGFSQLAAIADASAVAAGNVTLFPKYQVLAANKAAFGRLGEAQRQVILAAAADTQADAITRHPDDAALAVAWCAQGGGVVDASAAQKAQLVAAVDPVYTQLEADALTGQLITDIRALKAQTTASPGASPCSQASASPTSFPTPDTTGYAGTMVPDGVYRANITKDDLLSQGADAKFADLNWGVKTLTFANGRVSLNQGENGGAPCYGTATSVDGKVVRLVTESGGCGFDGDYVWREQGDGIALILTDAGGATLGDRAYFSRVWTRIQ